MSAVARVGTVVVPVTDQDRALAFYRDAFGFEVRIDGTFGDGRRWLEVAPPGAETSLALVPADGMEVSLATRDAASGMFRFRDPDGNRFRVVERE